MSNALKRPAAPERTAVRQAPTTMPRWALCPIIAGGLSLFAGLAWLAVLAVGAVLDHLDVALAVEGAAVLIAVAACRGEVRKIGRLVRRLAASFGE